MFMRIAVCIHGMDIDRVIETYDLMSTNFYVHASSTLSYAGTDAGHLSSSSLLQLWPKNIEHAFRTLTDCTRISMESGNVGLGAQLVTSAGSVAAILDA